MAVATATATLILTIDVRQPGILSIPRSRAGVPSIDLLWFSCRGKRRREGEFLFSSRLSSAISHLYRALVARSPTFHHGSCVPLCASIDDTIAIASLFPIQERDTPCTNFQRFLAKKSGGNKVGFRSYLPSLPYFLVFVSLLFVLPSLRFFFVPVTIDFLLFPAFAQFLILYILFFTSVSISLSSSFSFSCSLHSNFSFPTLHLSSFSSLHSPNISFLTLHLLFQLLLLYSFL